MSLLRYRKGEKKMWKLIVLLLAMALLLLAPGEKLRKPQKGKERKQKKESDYFNSSGPIPPIGPEL